MTRKRTNSRMQEKLNNFEEKYGSQENIIKKVEWINNMAKELERLEEGPKAEMHINLLRMTLKNIKLENPKPWWNTWLLVQ